MAERKRKRRGKKKPTGKERMDRARKEISASINPAQVMIPGAPSRALAQVVVDPLRVQMLMTSTLRKLSATEFAEEWDIPPWGAHYHFKVLRDRGFVRIVEKVRRRGATEIFYRATKHCFIPDADWAALNPMFKGPITHAIVEELWRVIAEAAEADTLDARDESIIWWHEVPLDEITFPKAMAMQRLLIERLVALGDETAKNQAEGTGGKRFPGVLALMGFEGAADKKPRKKRKRKGNPGEKEK